MSHINALNNEELRAEIDETIEMMHDINEQCQAAQDYIEDDEQYTRLGDHLTECKEVLAAREDNELMDALANAGILAEPSTRPEETWENRHKPLPSGDYMAEHYRKANHK